MAEGKVAMLSQRSLVRQVGRGRVPCSTIPYCAVQYEQLQGQRARRRERRPSKKFGGFGARQPPVSGLSISGPAVDHTCGGRDLPKRTLWQPHPTAVMQERFSKLHVQHVLYSTVPVVYGIKVRVLSRQERQTRASLLLFEHAQ